MTRRRQLRAVLTVSGLAAAFLYLAAIYVLLSKIIVFLKFNDFGKFYLSVQQFRHGSSLYATNDATLIPLSNSVSQQFLNLNPPHFHFLVWPFALMPEGIAFIAWAAFNVALALLSWRTIQRELRLTISANQGLIGALLVCAAAPTIGWFVTGQLTGVLVILVTRIWVDARNRRWEAAGIGIGIACALKVFFAPLALFLLFRRKWSGVAACAIAAIAVFAVGLFFFGVSEYTAWIQALSAVSWQWPPMNASVSAPLARFANLDPLHSHTLAPATRLAMNALSVAVLAGGLWAAVRARELDDAFTVLLLTSILASPLGWIYYHWIAAGPALVTFKRPSVGVWAAFAGLLIPFLWLFPWPSAFVAVTVGSLYSWCTLVLWFAAVSRARVRT